SARLINHRIRDATACSFQKIDKTVDSDGHFTMNQRITTRHANIFSNACGESNELQCRIFPLIGEGRLEPDPSMDNFFGTLLFFPIEHSSVCDSSGKSSPVYTRQV